MSIKKRISIPMITLIIICCIAILASSVLLFNREQRNSMNDKLDVALNVVEQEIAYMLEVAYFTSYSISANNDLVDALKTGESERVAEVADMLKAMSTMDYCVIMDKDGFVLARTHDPESIGDNAAHLPHVNAALGGRTEAHIMQGISVALAVSAGSPVYDENRDIIGAVSIGYVLSDQDFVRKLHNLTGCEITFFKNDERVSSTLLNADGSYALGEKAAEYISEIVLAGESFFGNIDVFGENVLAHYSPLYGVGDEIVGMVFVGFRTAEETNKVLLFILYGALITIGVVVACIVLVRVISGVIERRLESMMEENKLQLVLLDAVLKSTKVALWEMEVVEGDPVNPYNKITWSDDFRRLMGYQDEKDFPDVLSSWSDRLHPDDREFALTAFSKHMLDRTGQTPFDVEYQLLKKNNVFAYYRATGETLRAEDGTPIRVAGALMDINDAKEFERAISETNERLHLMLDTSPVGTQILDKNQNIIDCNSAAVKLYGFKNKQEYIERFRSDCNPEFQPDGSPSDELAQKFVDEAFETGRCSFEWMHQNPDDKTPIPTEITLVRVKYIGDDVLLGYTRDLRDYKAYLAELEKSREERFARETAEEANRTKTKFLANMSHEIRTPMNSIIGFSELAQYGDIPHKTREYLFNIQESAQWLLEIINDILDISKIESGRIDLENIPFDLPNIFTHCQSVIIPKTIEKGIMLYCYAEPSVGKKLIGDPIRLRQVILNLLSNAVKFTNSGTVKLLASLKETDEKHVTISFEVKDSGIGMTPEQLEKIFDPFKQADESITRKFGGTGLGLTITKNIIELMGGNLQVESAPGIGSRFSFDIPFAFIDSDSDEVPEGLVINDFEIPKFKGMVLVCEDNSLNQQVVCDHLARVGLRTVVAHNGKEAVSIVAERLQNAIKGAGAKDNSHEKPFDVIFMDIHMPIMDGMEAAKKIVEMGVKTPIVALTANIMSNDLEHYRQCGMYDTLGKPFTANELWRCLARYISVESYTAVDKFRMSEEEKKTRIKLKRNFARSNQKAYTDLIETIDAGDFKTAHRQAHTLKSNAAQIDAKRLRDAAASAEAVLKEEKRLTSEQRKILELELNTVLDELKPLLLDNENEDLTEITDKKQIREILDTVEPLLRSNSTKILRHLDDIKSIPETWELVKQIEEYNFDLALEEFEEVKRKWEGLNDGEA